MSDPSDDNDSERLFAPHPAVEGAEPRRAEPRADTRQVFGLVGRDADDAFIRLYASPDATSYFRIAKRDVVGREDLTAEQLGAAFDAARIDVRAGAEVELVRTTTHRVAADFLQGGLTEAFLPRAAPLAPGAPAARAAEESFVCTLRSSCASEVCATAFCAPPWTQNWVCTVTQTSRCNPF